MSVVGAVWLPLYKLSCVTALFQAVLAVVTRSCSLVRSSLSVPLSACVAKVASTALRLSAVTPVRPMSAKSLAVKAGSAVPPAAVNWMASTTRANAASSACVSTSVVLACSSTSFIKLALAAVLMAGRAMAWYCAALRLRSSSLVLSAAARMVR